MPPRSRPQRHRDDKALDDRANTIHGLSVRVSGGEANIAPEELAKSFCKADIPLLMSNVNVGTVADMFTLFSLALRGSDGEGADQGARVSYRKLRKAIAVYVSEALTSPRKDDMHRKELLVYLTLHTHVLRCYAGLLRGAGRQLQRQPGHSSAAAAAELLSEVIELVSALDPNIMEMDWGSGRNLPRKTAMSRTDYMRSLLAELNSSTLLAAWASCYLHLVASSEWSNNEATMAVRKFGTIVNRLNQMWRYGSHFSPAPGILYLLAAHVVRAVAVMDGATTYGMVGDAPQLPVWSPDGDPVRSGSGGTLDTHLLVAALEMWEKCQRCYGAHAPAHAAFPPYNRPATFDICIRLLDAAHAASMAPIVPAQQRQRRRSGPVRLLRDSCGLVASLALLLAAGSLRELVRRHPAGARPVDVERLRALWAAYMRVLDAAMEAMGNVETAVWFGSAVVAGGSRGDSSFRRVPFYGDWNDFDLPCITSMVPAGGSIARPCIDAEVVLSTGVMTRMERLVRLQHSEPRLVCGAATWLQLLMFGPVAEIAALIASVAKSMWKCVQQLDRLLARRPDTKMTELIWIRLPEGLDAATGYLTQVPQWQELMGIGMPGISEAGGAGASSAAEAAAGSSSASSRSRGSITAGGGEGSAGDGAGAADAGCSTGGESGDEGGGVGDGGLRDSAAVAAVRPGGTSSLMPGVRQLLELTTFTAVRLLPALSKAVQCFELPGFASISMPPSFVCVGLALRECELLLSAALPMPATDVEAQSAAAASPAAAQWRVLLLHDVDVVGLLGAAANVLSAREQIMEEKGAQECAKAFAGALAAACAVFPAEVRAAMAGDPEAARICRGRDGAGATVEADAGAAAAPASGRAPGAGDDDAVWTRPAFCAYLTLPNLTMLLGPAGDFPDEQALAAVTALMDPGAVPVAMVRPDFAATAAALPPPDEVRRRMAAHCCANPGCINMEGPSEACLPRLRCGGGCGGSPWWYCSEGCQAAHWRAGHKEECEAAGARAGGSQG